MQHLNSFFNKRVLFSATGQVKAWAAGLSAAISRGYEHPVGSLVRRVVFNTPAGLGLTAALLCCLAAVVLPGPVYMVGDDIVMRGRIEGNYINGLPPSEFAEFLTVNAGLILRFLYEAAPGFYWYDLLWYAFLSMSVFAVVYVLSENAREYEAKYKIVAALGLPIIFSIAFIAPQFTVVAAFLTISAVAVFISMIRPVSISWPGYLAKSLYIIFALCCAGLVRMDSALAVTALCVFLLFPFMPWKKPKRLVLILVPVLIGWLGILAIMHSDAEARRNHPVWNYWNEYNKANVALVNDSLFSAGPDRWEIMKSLKDRGINFYSRDDFIWDDARYRLLMNYHFLDDADGAFELGNLEKVASAYTDQVKLTGQMRPGLRFEKNNPDIYADAGKWFQKYLWVFAGLILVFRKRIFIQYTAFFLAAFWVFGCLMGLVYKPLPLRLLYPLALLPLICLLLFSKSSPAGVFKPNPRAETGKRLILKNMFDWLAVAALILICCTTVQPQSRANKKMMHNYREFNSFVTTLNRGLIYGLEFFIPYLTRPFDRCKMYDLGLKVIHFSTPLEDEAVRSLYAGWYSSTGKNDFRELFGGNRFRLISETRYGGLRPDIAYYMRKIYGKSLAVFDDAAGFRNGKKRRFSCYRYVILNEREAELRRRSMVVHYSTLPEMVRLETLKSYILDYSSSYDGDDLVKSLEAIYNHYDLEDLEE